MFSLNEKISVLQILIVLMFLVLFFYFYFKELILIPEIILSIIFIFIIFLLKKETLNEFKFYVLFFGFILFVFWLSFFAVVFVKENLIKLNFSIFILIALIVFILLFKLFFGRNYCFGEVLLSDNEIAVIKKDFDLLSFSNKGEFIVKTNKAYKKGEKVKVLIGYKDLKRKPLKIIEL